MLSTHTPTSPSRWPRRSTTRHGCGLPSTDTLTVRFVTPCFRVFVRESERSEVHGFERPRVLDPEGNAHETRFLLTAAAQIDVKRAFRELEVLYERQTDVAADRRIAVRFQSHDGPFDAGVGVDHPPAFRVVDAPEIRVGHDARIVLYINA